MSNPQQDILSRSFGFWRGVADETVRHLGEETAGVFVSLFNDALDILGAIHDTYPEEKRVCSLVYADFTGLFKDLHGLHILFLCGQYRLVLSQLRFNWERIFRARHADAYAEENPNETDVPGPTLDDKHDWLMKRKYYQLNWSSLIVPTLTRLFSAGAPAGVEAHFMPLWDRLNRCVHPSGELREKLLEPIRVPVVPADDMPLPGELREELVGETALHIRDAFHERWARETHADAVEVFGLICLAVLSQFPAAVPKLLADPGTFRDCPQLRAALGGVRLALHESRPSCTIRGLERARAFPRRTRHEPRTAGRRPHPLLLPQPRLPRLRPA